MGMVRARSCGRLVFAAVVLTALAACDGGWAQFRADAERTGYNPRETALVAGNVSGLQVAWSVPIPGIVQPDGGGNVAVGSGKVFLAATDGTVRAYVAATGAVAWSAPAPGATGVVVTGGRVLVSTNDRNVNALDAASGARVWRRPTLGYPSTPTVVGDRVYVVGSDSRLSTYDVATGAPVGTSFPVAASGDIAVSSVDGSIYLRTDRTVESAAREVQAYDADGTLRWSVSVPGPSGNPPPALTPVLAQGRVYLGGRAYDQLTGELVWASSTADWYSSPAYAEGTLYGLRTFGLGVTALDPATGQTRWSATGLGDAFPDFGDGPAVTPGVVWVNAGRRVRALDAASGALLWSSDPAVVTADAFMPVVAGGRVFSVSGTDVAPRSTLTAWRVP